MSVDILAPPPPPPSRAHARAPHSSTPFHLATDTAVLDALYVRSKHQHRSQLFLRELVHVRRLAHAAMAAASARHTSSSTSSLSNTGERLEPLLRKLVPAIIAASTSSTRTLALHHFVPLQTLLLATYARLLAAAMHLAGTTLNLDAAELLGAVVDDAVAPGKTVAEPKSVLHQVGHGGGDIGERVARTSSTMKAPGSSASAPTVPAKELAVAKALDRNAIPKSSSSTSAVTAGTLPRNKYKRERFPAAVDATATGSSRSADADAAAASSSAKSLGAGRGSMPGPIGGEVSTPRGESMGAAIGCNKRLREPEDEDEDSVAPQSTKLKSKAASDLSYSPRPSSDAAVKEKKKVRKDKGDNKDGKVKSKKKKKDAMDDIFGF